MSLCNRIVSGLGGKGGVPCCTTLRSTPRRATFSALHRVLQVHQSRERQLILQERRHRSSVHLHLCRALRRRLLISCFVCSCIGARPISSEKCAHKIVLKVGICKRARRADVHLHERPKKLRLAHSHKARTMSSLAEVLSITVRHRISRMQLLRLRAALSRSPSIPAASRELWHRRGCRSNVL